MKVTFLGTRGYIKPKSIWHRMHTSMMVAYRGKRVMIDCGESWIGRIADFKPRAIVITHPHPDHACGLKLGSPCPVYATAEAWKKMKKFPIQKQFRRVLQPRRPERIEGITFEAFPVVHSVRAPAVGYKRIHRGALCESPASGGATWANTTARIEYPRHLGSTSPSSQEAGGVFSRSLSPAVTQSPNHSASM